MDRDQHEPVFDVTGPDELPDDTLAELCRLLLGIVDAEENDKCQTRA